MFKQKITYELTTDTKILVVSDIHLQFPISKEQEVIARSLVKRIDDLSKSKKAVLVLNGDVLELWEQINQNIEDILTAFKDLTQSIKNFADKKNHSVIYTIGNHDDILRRSAADRAVIKKYWHAELCNTLDLVRGRKIIRIEHGHENDPYNKTSDNENPHGKELVQKTLPVLIKTMPTLFTNIGDVVNRSLLPSFVLSNLTYKIIFPYVFSLVALTSGILSIVLNDNRIAAATILTLIISWLLILVADLVLRFVAEHALGGGSKYMNRVDEYAINQKINVLVYGHTHNGRVEKRNGYVYANSGCNDVIAKPRVGWLGLYKFNRYIQMSDITIDESKKESIKYNQEIIPLVE